jgi:Uma2 family endonuclease
MVSSSPQTTFSSDRPTDWAESGWKIDLMPQPNGSPELLKVPLTAAEFLHPQEGYRLPNSTFHDTVAGDAKDILTRRYANQPDVGVFRDLLIGWDIKDLGDHCPDTFVVFGMSDRHRNRTKFVVTEEGARPSFILEVVSPRYRKEDREAKVIEYAKAKVQEYVIIDQRIYRGQTLEEVLGYRLVAGHYQPLTPDDEGRIFSETLGLLISLQNSRLILEDVQTGDRLLSALELAQESANAEALLQRYRERFGALED